MRTLSTAPSWALLVAPCKLPRAAPKTAPRGTGRVAMPTLNPRILQVLRFLVLVVRGGRTLLCFDRPPAPPAHQLLMPAQVHDHRCDPCARRQPQLVMPVPSLALDAQQQIARHNPDKFESGSPLLARLAVALAFGALAALERT